MFKLGYLLSQNKVLSIVNHKYKEYEQKATTSVVTLQKGSIQKVLWIVFHVTIGITKSNIQIIQLE